MVDDIENRNLAYAEGMREWFGIAPGVKLVVFALNAATLWYLIWALRRNSRKS